MLADLKNIEAKMQEIALEQSAQFVLDNMVGIPSFDSSSSLMQYALRQSGLDNEALLCEFGVGSGTSINRLATLINPRIVHGFDSFAGLPEDWRDSYRQGHFRLDAPPMIEANVKLWIGLFKDTLPDFLAHYNHPIGFVHIDCDLYSSTKCVLDQLAFRMRKDTVLLFDEFFNYPGWQLGEYRAFCEFTKKEGFTYEWLGYCRYHEQVAVRLH